MYKIGEKGNNIIMKIKDEETLEERLYRQNLIFSEQRNQLPKIVALLVIGLLAALFVGYSRQAAQIEAYGPGAPYICETCKNLGRACKDHRNFDSQKALHDKVVMFVDRYKADGSESNSKYAIYGYGNEYNTECDFCNKDKTECYSCKFDREYLVETYNNIVKTDVFISKLCDDCWKSKKAECSLCKEMLIESIFNEIRGNKH